MHSLSGKRVLVTGGTTGIGRAIATLLVRDNARVLFFGRDQKMVDEAMRELPGAVGLSADVTKEGDCKRVFEAVDRELGGLDALINNAGIGAGSVIDTPEEEWRYAMEADLMGPMRMVALAFPRLKASGGGHIVNIGSMSAKVREPGSDVYVAAKMGLRGFSDTVGRHLAEHNINVTLVEPGLVQSMLTGQSPEEDAKRIDEATMLEEEDIARSVAFILSQPPRCTIPMIQVRPRMQLI